MQQPRLISAWLATPTALGALGLPPFAHSAPAPQRHQPTSTAPPTNVLPHVPPDTMGWCQPTQPIPMSALPASTAAPGAHLPETLRVKHAQLILLAVIYTNGQPKRYATSIAQAAPTSTPLFPMFARFATQSA